MDAQETLEPPSAQRVIAGILVGPAVPALLLLLVHIAWQGFSGYPLLSYATLLYGYPAALIFGVPAYLILQKMRFTSATSYVVAGLAIGLAAMALFLVVRPGLINPSALTVAQNFIQRLAPFGIFTALCGAVAGASFWFVAFRWAK